MIQFNRKWLLLQRKENLDSSEERKEKEERRERKMQLELDSHSGVHPLPAMVSRGNEVQFSSEGKRNRKGTNQNNTIFFSAIIRIYFTKRRKIKGRKNFFSFMILLIHSQKLYFKITDLMQLLRQF